jgi:hypothetical protein
MVHITVYTAHEIAGKVYTETVTFVQTIGEMNNCAAGLVTHSDIDRHLTARKQQRQK